MYSSNDSLPTGYWDKGGCTDDVSPINGSTVTCQCNHLTHFAILLSPRSDETSPVYNRYIMVSTISHLSFHRFTLRY